MNKLEKFFYGKAYKVMCAATSMVAGLMSDYSAVFAGSTEATKTAEDIENEVTSPMMSLISVVLSVLQVVGVFMLVKAIADLVNSIQHQDNSGMYSAGRSIAAAVLMISLKIIIPLFGVEL